MTQYLGLLDTTAALSARYRAENFSDTHRNGWYAPLSENGGYVSPLEMARRRMVEREMPSEFTYERWRHGGWYVHEIVWPNGGSGCVARNFADRKWRIACDPRPFDQQPTFKTRDEAARGEWSFVRGLVLAEMAKYEEFRCTACGRDEAVCSADPCPQVVQDRGEASTYDGENRCRGCREHIADPHAPGCPSDDDEDEPRECAHCGDQVEVGLSSRDWCDGCEKEAVRSVQGMLIGAGLFDLRKLSTPTLRQLHDSVQVGPKAETEFFAMARRILIERGALS